MKQKYQLLLIMFILASVANATDYFVKNAGSDGADGLSDGNAWETISKVNGESFSPGDTISFKRGDTWREQLTVPDSGSNGSPIIFGAYGSGDAPIISGADVFSTWTAIGGNVYTATATTEVKGLWINGVFKNKSRFPTSGWNSVSFASEDKLSITDTGVLTQADDTWIGTMLVLRNTDWSIKKRIISDSDQGDTTVTWETVVQRVTPVGYGYYIEGRVADIDTTNRWTWNSNLCYLFDDTQDPDDGDEVLGSVRDYCINISNNKSYITIDGLDIRHARLVGILSDGSENLIIQNCNIQDTLGRAIEIEDGVNYNKGGIVIQGNVITDIQARDINILRIGAVGCRGHDGVLFTENILTNIGINEASPVTATGIDTDSNNTVISKNTITNVSSKGMRLRGARNGTIISGNTISEYMEYASDGGGIYIYTDLPSGGLMIINNNLCHTAIGYILGSTLGKAYAFGIYLDENTANVRVYNNICHSMPEGYGFHNNGVNSSEWYNNTVSGCLTGFRLRENIENDTFDNIIMNNIFSCTLSASDRPVHISGSAGTTANIATFNNNLYENISDTAIVKYDIKGIDTDYTLAQWQSAQSQDAQSINANPQFVDAASNNFKLNVESPCIDAGIDVGLTVDFLENAINGFHIGAFNKYGPYLIGVTP